MVGGGGALYTIPFCFSCFPPLSIPLYLTLVRFVCLFVFCFVSDILPITPFHYPPPPSHRFTSEVHANLHVVFTMNPASTDFSSRAATSPALFNRCCSASKLPLPLSPRISFRSSYYLVPLLHRNSFLLLCFIVINPRVLSANRVDSGLFFFGS